MGLRFAGRWLGRRPASTLEDIYLAIDTSGHPVYIDWCERHLLVIARVIPEKVPSLRIFLFKLNHLHKLD